MQLASSSKCNGINGNIAIPGDKSISHRSLIIPSQAIGTSTISNLLESEDVLATMHALQAMGVKITKQGNTYQVQGIGVGGLSQPNNVLDMENTGTGARLLMGLVAPYEFSTFFTGDASLNKRPMGRITKPLQQMLVNTTTTDGRMPLVIHGNLDAIPIEYHLPVASAQVKSAVLLAGLNIDGTTSVIEDTPTRDHTERMLKSFGANIITEQLDNGATKISVQGYPQLKAQDITVPADPSSAAFFVVAALITPGSSVTLKNICMNPARIGLFNVLKQMGGDISIHNMRQSGGEDIADITANYSQLQAVETKPEIAASMIDEYPILAVACAYANGTSKLNGLEELKVKESNRLQAIYDGLIANKIDAQIGDDYLIIKGGIVQGGGVVTTHMDHRIAMSFLVMGLNSSQPVQVDDAGIIATSFPNFVELINNNGGNIVLDGSSLAQANYTKPYVIAIDGPAASGKGTLARKLAAQHNFDYLDTGRIYRAVGLKLIDLGLDANNLQHAVQASKSIRLSDLSDRRLRQEQVGNYASIISAYPEVRQVLLDFQRDFIKGSNTGAVLDGRDIGTVVCPEADVKLFITASVDARAKRRYEELLKENIGADYNSILADLKERDERDKTRKKAPLVAANDAITIDTTKLNASQVFEQINKLIKV